MWAMSSRCVQTTVSPTRTVRFCWRKFWMLAWMVWPPAEAGAGVGVAVGVGTGVGVAVADCETAGVGEEVASGLVGTGVA